MGPKLIFAVVVVLWPSPVTSWPLPALSKPYLLETWGRAHSTSPFGPETPEQPWPNRSVALPSAGHRVAARSEVVPGHGACRDGDGCYPGSCPSQVPPWVGMWVWHLPFSPPKHLPWHRLALPASQSTSPKAQWALTALSCVLQLSQTTNDFEAESCCFGERLLSEPRGPQSVIGGCHHCPQVRGLGTSVLPQRVRRAFEAGGGCLDYESLELGRGGGIGKGSKGLFLLLKPSAKSLAPSHTSGSLCLPISHPTVSVLPGVEGGRGEADPWIETWRRPARGL